MPFTVKYNNELSIIESVLVGQVTKKDLLKHEEQCIALAKENESTCIISDAKQATLEISVFDLYSLPEYYGDQGLQRSVRIAVLPPTSEAGKDLVEFYETVSINRGWTVGIFEERQEALDWLLDDGIKK